MIRTPAQYKEMEYIHVMINIIKLAPHKRYCELGVKKAYTFNNVLPYVDHAVGVDIMNSEPYINGVPEDYEFNQMTTAEFASNYRGPKFDFIFIDADHSKEAVLNDICMMERYLVQYSGIMFLHDTFPAKVDLLKKGYCFNAWEAAHFVHNQLEDWEIVTIPFPWAGFSIMRYCPEGKHGWMSFEPLERKVEDVDV
jgi:hypothetical protein